MSPIRLVATASALVIATVVGGTLIASASAAPAAPASDAEGAAAPADGEYCDLFLSTLAAELGVEADALVPAARSAAVATISAMIEAGDVPADVGERMIERIDSASGDGCAMLGLRFAHGLHAAGVADWLRDSAHAAANALGIEVPELRERMRAGESLEEIAEAEGIDYAVASEAVLAATEADLDAAVEAGRMTQERADRLLGRVSEWLADGGQPRPRPFHR